MFWSDKINQVSTLVESQYRSVNPMPSVKHPVVGVFPCSSQFDRAWTVLLRKVGKYYTD